MERIKSCRVCKSQNIIEFLDLGEQPFANSLLKNLDEKERFYPLSLSWCSDCNLVQLNQTAEPTDLFSEYVWVTSTSQTAREHSKILYNAILSRTQSLEQGYILEVGSNDGTFLLPFIQNNYKVLGVDPAQNIVDIAIANGVSTKCRFFGVKAAEEIIEEFGQAKLVIARNVLPHVANLHDFVKGLHMCLGEDGLLVLEVHYARIIYEELHYDSIYHEHLCYFTLKSIEKLLNQFNLFVTDIRESPISGGSLILYVKNKEGAESPTVQSYRDAEKEIRVNELSGWENFAKRVQLHHERLLETLNNAVEEGGPIVGYGASARSSTLLNFCGVDTRYISMIADQNPLKHRRFTAGTHIPIDSPENVMKQNPRFVALLAWNFTDEIIDILRKRFGYTGKCIIPLPNNPKIKDVGIK
ncbi:MAG: Ubiquinone biosynthesis O-methyltransferase [candidate division WS2 bacterium]|nr:Ubiquinone biosynthesis O-methyltransferase [Candidatus Psychracetigena formicireducens]